MSQSFANWELVLVDNVSQDATPEVVNSFNDVRVRYIRHEKNEGEAAGRDAGVDHALGRYIAFLDDDDEWLPKKLERQVALFEAGSRELGLVYCGVIFVDDSSGAVRYKSPRLRGYVPHKVLSYNGIGTPSSVMIRRDVLLQMGGFDKTLATAADWDMWIRVTQKYSVDFVDEPLVIYREHRSSTTGDPKRIMEGWQRLWEKHRVLERGRSIKSLNFFRLGHNLCYRGDSVRGRAFIQKALATEPWKVHRLALYLLAWGAPHRYHDITFKLQGLASGLFGRSSLKSANWATPQGPP
jgi:glycosyltransferase involved in cell wall biosynthesis